MKKLLLLLTCLCLAFAVTACGDDSEDESSTPANNNAAENNNTPSENNNTPSENNNTPSENNNTPSENNNTPSENNSTPGPDVTDPVVDGSPSDYDFSVPSAYLNDLDIETDPTIGADINGDGQPDNGLGTILSNLGSLLGDTDVNAELDNAIAEGSLALGTTWPTFADGVPADAEDVKVHFFLLDDAGDGTFTADAASFVENSQTPLIRLAGGTVSGGTLNAGPTDFFLSIPLGEISLDVVVSDAQITGDISAADNGGVDLVNGSIAGAVSRDNIFEALNGFAAGECGCLGLSEPLIDIAASACAPVDTDACEAEENSTCASIGSFCGTAVQLIGPLSDIDLDGDGSNDAISVFLHMEMQGADITGVTPE